MNTQEKNSHTAQTKTNSKYHFVQRDGDDFTCIKLLEEKYEGVIYKYGNVRFGDKENPDGTLPMMFDYDILRNPNNKDVADDEDFMEYIGDILIELMEKQIQDGTAIIKWAYRNHNS